MGPVAAILVILAILAAIVVGYYNKFVKMRNMVDNAWAQVDVQLQRRYDLVPNLVETVKAYAVHEQQTLEAITQARSSVGNANTYPQRVQAENALTSAIRGLVAVAENYPELKASQNYQALQSELASTEDKISYMRQSFNDTVMKYNTAIQQFPGTLLAGPFGFTRRSSFDADLEADEALAVGFSAADKEPVKSEAELLEDEFAALATKEAAAKDLTAQAADKAPAAGEPLTAQDPSAASALEAAAPAEQSLDDALGDLADALGQEPAK